MRKPMTVLFAAWLIMIGLSLPVLAGESATPQEIYAKVIEAAGVLEELGAEGLAAFKDPKGEFVWKDTYVWVMDCANWTLFAHPLMPELVGKDLKMLKDKKTGRLFFQEMCGATKSPQGGWTEYWWPKPGQPKDKIFRKISFAIQVPNQPYQVAAGIYNDTMTIEDLKKIK